MGVLCSCRTSQAMVPITNVLAARIHLWKNTEQVRHFALKQPYYNPCADLKKRGGGGGESPLIGKRGGVPFNR